MDRPPAAGAEDFLAGACPWRGQAWDFLLDVWAKLRIMGLVLSLYRWEERVDEFNSVGTVLRDR